MSGQFWLRFIGTILILTCLSVSACSRQKTDLEGCNCPVAAGAPGATFWVMPESLISIYGKSNIQKCNVKKYDGDRVTGKDMFGNFYQFATENGSKKEPICVSLVKYQKVNDLTIAFRKGNGKDEKWMGRAILGEMDYGDTIYEETAEGNYVKTGEADFQEAGLGYKVRVTKGLSQNDRWTYELGGKVYQFIQGKWVNVGECGYYWVTPENGTRLETLGLMSRGLDKNSKWCGVIDGVVYLEK